MFTCFHRYKKQNMEMRSPSSDAMGVRRLFTNEIWHTIKGQKVEERWGLCKQLFVKLGRWEKQFFQTSFEKQGYIGVEELMQEKW